MKVEQNQLYANEQIHDSSTCNGSAKLDSRVGVMPESNSTTNFNIVAYGWLFIQLKVDTFVTLYMVCIIMYLEMIAY